MRRLPQGLRVGHGAWKRSCEGDLGEEEFGATLTDEREEKGGTSNLPNFRSMANNSGFHGRICSLGLEYPLLFPFLVTSLLIFL